MVGGEDWVTDLHFDELVNGVTLLERVLRQERAIVWERCRREIDSTPDKVIETDEGIEIRLDERKQEIACEIEQVYQEVPRILMNNMVVSAWSLFENHMTGLVRSRIIAKAGLSDGGFKATGRIRDMKDVVDYFKQEDIALPPGWDFVDQIRELRNQIVHDGGIRHVLDDATDPVELKRHRRTLSIDKFVEEREAMGQKGIWYIYDGTLCTSAEFCREILEFFRDYVKVTKRLTHVPFDDEAFRSRMRTSEQKS